MKAFIDEITGLEEHLFDQTTGPQFLVTSNGRNAWSTHNSAAAARAYIVWKWQRKYPELTFEVIPL